jgi:glycosyltransferase involved in cell wall biosynthesis
VLVGRGTYSEELRGVARGLGVQQAVQFAGFVSDEELVRLLNEATCAVIPSLYEPFGIVALEALSAGAPLIAAESGGLREVLGGTDAGLLFPPGNADALAAAFDRMTTEPGLVAKSQAAGTELVATKYSWDAIAASTIDVYLDAGAKPPTTKPKKAGKGK